MTTVRAGGRRVRTGVACLLLAAGLALTSAAPAWSQVVNPVYVDDSPAARDTLLRVRDHLASGNLAEAARIVQVMLDEMPDRLVPAGGQSAGGKAEKDDGGASAGARNLFVAVRAEARRVLLSDRGLLDRYRADFGPVAQEKLAAGGIPEVERSYLLTSAGFEAALRLAQRQMEDARFNAAILTLRQLQGHPDLAGQGKKDAAALAGQLARYLDAPAVRELVTSFGGEVPGEPAPWPSAARIAGSTPLDTATKADLGAVLGKPLRSVSISDDRLVPSLLQAIRPVETERLPATARHLVILPTVADDTLYLNDGLQISAWDRITLTPRWSVSGEMPTGEESIQAASNLRGSMRGNPALQDATMVAVSGRTAVAALGLAVGSMRWPDERVVAIDTLSGKVRWAVSVDELDPVLANQKVRGPVIISEGTAVVTLRASLPDRRMVTLYQAGLDLANGQLRWARLLGSTGALPYRDDPYVSDASQIADGVVYQTDMLGVVSATEAASGRPVWLRRMPPVAAQTWDSLNPWQMGSPIVTEKDVVLLSPDHRKLVRLDRSTGEVRGEAETARFEQQGARYVLRVGNQVALVFDNRIALAPIDSFETATAKLTPRFGQPGINGRVTAAGDKLLVPVVEGVLVVDATNPEGEATLMPLDSPGNLLALESQLLVVDDTSVHSYLLWEVAEKLLSARMAEAPSDPTAATTLAELAYRAGKHDRIVPAVDAALSALSRAPDSAEAEPTRERLFGSLSSMIADALERGTGPGSDQSTPKITADALLSDIIDRMGRAAKSPDERLTHALARGRLAEHRSRPGDAVDTYQGVLDDEALATATWSGPRLSTRGELEVTRRLETLVAEHGASVYSAHDARASREAGQLQGDAPAEALVRLATRFPVAGEAARLWERAATAYRASGRDHAVVGAMESALHAAERIPGGPRVGEVAGALITELEARQQFAAAGNALKNVQERHPGVVITIAGAPADTKTLATRLAQQVAARQRWPRVGELSHEGVQVLAGWTLMEPMMRPRQPIAPRGVVMKSADHVGLYLPGETAGAGGVPELNLAWKRPIDTELFELIRLDSEAAYFFFATAKGAVIEKVSQAPAALKWQTPLLADIPARIPTRPGRPEMAARIPTPQDGLALLTDGVITMDDRTIVLLERQGFATALDTQSGAVLWTIRSPLDRVYDATVAGGSLIVAGDQEITAGPGERVEDLKPEIVVLDARTGQEVQRLSQRWGGVRWVRMADSGQLVAGCENAIVSTDLSRGQVNWMLSDPHLASSRDAWIFGDSVFILDRDRRLWLANARNGSVSPDALEAPRARLDGVRRIEASLVPAADGQGEPLVAFSTYQGVLLYDLHGVLKGVDAVGGLDGLIPPVPASDRMVTITTMPEGRRDDRDLLYSIYELDTRSSMVVHSSPIVLTVPPRSVGVLDGRVLITSGGSSVSIPAPLKDTK